MVKAVSPIKTRRNHWAGDTSLVGAGVGSNPTRNQVFLIAFDLALDLGESDSSSIHQLKFYTVSQKVLFMLTCLLLNFCNNLLCYAQRWVRYSIFE